MMKTEALNGDKGGNQEMYFAQNKKSAYNLRVFMVGGTGLEPVNLSHVKRAL